MIYLSVVEVFFPSTGEHCRERVFNRIGGYQKTSVSFFRGWSFASVGENDYICGGKPTKDPEKVCFVTNFVTPRNNNVGFLLSVS